MNKPLHVRSRAAFGWLVAVIIGCDLPGAPNPADRPVPPQEVQDFALLFQRNCAGCHGVDGKLGPAPPLNDPLFLAIVPDAELLKVVRDGRRGTPMPGFAPSTGGPLTDEQAQIIAAGIKTHWPHPNPAAANVTTPPQYAVGAGNVERGRTVFAEACAECHGAKGEGGSQAGAIHDPALLSLLSDKALRRIIITGRPDLYMPDYAGVDGRADDFQPLTSAEIDDLVALLAEWRKEAAAQPTLAGTPDSD